MEIVIDLLKEYGIYLLINSGIFLSVFLGRPKTAEKLEKKKQKQKQKLLKKAKKRLYKVQKKFEVVFGSIPDSEEIVDIHEPWLDEVNKNG